MTIRRFSSRTERLDRTFLSDALKGAVKYFRIAGYFRSSIFELVGEEIARIPEVRIVCNSELDLLDFQVATGRESALKERWNEVDVEAEAMLHKERYRRLDELLRAGNVEIRVVPRERLFLHGKAGAIHYSDGKRRGFIGSVNETKSAFSENYELVWMDDDEESADWIEEEFHALWREGVPLPEAICAEVHRVANRREITMEAARSDPEALPASIMAEAPIYRGGEQLQPWQRSFVTLFMEHEDVRKSPSAAGGRGWCGEDTFHGDKRPCQRCDGREARACPRSLDPDPPVADRDEGQARHSERGVVVPR